ncbi:MAG: hypothetical protein ACRDLN_11925 [Solirubrobacteraceae bacterium]
MRADLRRSRGAPAAVVALCCALLAACGGGEDVPSDATRPALRPASFGQDPATDRNAWYPLTPGIQSVKLGKVNRGSRRLTHRRVTTVTDVGKEIAGVRSVVVLDQDFDGGEIAEQALDYLAVDRSGNVWQLGSYTEAYEGGRFVNAGDGWLAGLKDARAGILLPADPRPGAPPYVQAQEPGNDPDVAEVARIEASKCVPYKCYENVLVVVEGGSENKYFAREVGEIGLAPRESGGDEEVEELVNYTRLSARGLAELSAEARRLDRHAAQTVPDVFAASKAAERLR